MSNTTWSSSASKQAESDVSVGALAEHVQALTDRLDAVEQELAAKDQQIEDLEAETNALREDLAAKDERIEFLTEELWTLEDIVLGEYDSAMAASITDEDGGVLERVETLEADTSDTASLQAELDAVREEVRSEQQTRSTHDSRIERRVSLLADKAGVDVADTAVAGEDKIQRLIEYGPDEIADRTYAWHYRARDLLAHAGDIGSKANDEFGKRITITGPDARAEFKKIRNERLSSSQIRRVFENIESLAADSPRRVTAKTGQSNDVNTLVVYLQHDELNHEE